MNIEEITIRSVLTQENARILMGKLAIREEDEFWIKKLIDLANKGFTDNMIIDEFHKQKYWVK